MKKQFIYLLIGLGGFILMGASVQMYQAIRHDATLSGDGTDASTLGVDTSGSGKIATKYQIRSGAVVGTDATPGIDDVLAVGQALTTNRSLDVSGYGVDFDISSSNNNRLVIQGLTGLIKTGDVQNNNTGFINVIDPNNDKSYYDNTAHNGMFGVNTSSPTVALDVVGSLKVQLDASGALNLNNNLGNPFFNFDNTSGNFTIGDDSGDYGGAEQFISQSGPTLYINSNGHTFNGSVKMSSYGAGAATFDSDGNITSVSDIRLKNVEHSYNVGLNEILKVNPIVYKWNDKSGMEQEHEYAGFSAQNVNAALGDLATGQNKDGYMSLQDRAILGALVNSIHELNDKIEAQAKEINRLKKHK